MRLKQYLTESINDKGIMKAIMLGGLSASGKTTIMMKVSDGNIPLKSINTDQFTEWFDPHNQNWKKYSGAVKKLTNAKTLNHFNSLLPVYIDSVSSNIDIFKKRLQNLEDMGYDVEMVFVNVSKRTSIKRSLNRYKTGGREVKIDFIKDTFDKFFCQGKYDTKDCTPPLGVFTSILGKENITIINNNDEMVTDEVINKIYNKLNKFLLSPVKNPKGKKLLDYMRQNGYKYYNEVPVEWREQNGLLVLDKSLKWY